jgi:hypothetical protein
MKQVKFLTDIETNMVDLVVDYQEDSQLEATFEVQGILLDSILPPVLCMNQ